MNRAGIVAIMNRAEFVPITNRAELVAMMSGVRARSMYILR